MNPNGTTWVELEKQLFSKEEIEDSKKRVKELIQRQQQDGKRCRK